MNYTTRLAAAGTIVFASACGQLAESSSTAPTDSAGGEIDEWMTDGDAAAPMLTALDSQGDVVAEMTVEADQNAAPTDRVTLGFVFPEVGRVSVARDGTLEGDVSERLQALARAAYNEFQSPPEPAEAKLLESVDGSNVDKSTANGSFRKEGGLFGSSGTETVGKLCPNGERRRAFRLREVDEVFGGSCDGEFAFSNTADCQLDISYSVALLSAVRCKWEVDSR